MHEQGFDDLQKRLNDLAARDMYRSRRTLDSPQGRTVRIDGRELLNFCSNDYLGLAGDPRVAAAFKAGIDRWGTGAGASHLICGHTGVHEELEVAVAEFTGRARALLYSSGYAANVGVINALLTVGDNIFQDRLNHASLLDGGWISRANFCWYKHLDIEDLEHQLSSVTGSNSRALVVSDGTFSMDGDRCRLDEMITVTRRHRAWLMIDDAHGMGVCGREGVGQVDSMCYSTVDVPILVGTLGKAFGTSGAFVAGDTALIETLIQRSRNYIYTTAIPSAIAAATLEALKIVRMEDWRRDRLRELIKLFRAGAKDIGFRLSDSSSPIQPLVVEDSANAVLMSRMLEDHGCLCTAIRPPTVPRGTSRLRVTLTAAHDENDVHRLLKALRATVERKKQIQ